MLNLDHLKPWPSTSSFKSFRCGDMKFAIPLAILAIIAIAETVTLSLIVLRNSYWAQN